MFGVDFFELAIIFGVALVVLGPKRLPGLVTKVGRMVGKARAMARQFREQLENEINLDELNKMTETRAKASGTETPPAGTPPPPPEFTGEPLPPLVVDPGIEGTAPDVHASPAPTPLDDTYSHAHATGDAPMPFVYENEFAPAPPEVVQYEMALPEPSQGSPHEAAPEPAPVKTGESHERQA
jgi:sec-independent protein translocase protein TatB